ncbi:WbqC family protein [Catenulispora yoronensis]|uniref:WbqC family protein n=1 Tax=Catenulispora yoronensis TaxID=450799 RepID=UPI003CD0A5C3
MTVSYPSPDPRPSVAAVAIRQPNLFPRLSTLAKLYASDTRVVLDDVQFNRRDWADAASGVGLSLSWG